MKIGRSVSFLGTFCYVLLGLSPVWADDTEIYFGNAKSVGSSNVLFVLDTSGSMDGDDDKNGTQRMDDMKAAFREVINSVDNVNVGIMRFSNPGGPILFPIRPVNQELSATEIPAVITQTITPSAATSDGYQFSSGYGINKVFLATNALSMGTEIPYQASTTVKTIDTRVLASADDAESIISGATTINNADLGIPTDQTNGSGKQVVGIRFSATTTLPARAGINSATMTLSSLGSSNSTQFPIPLKIVGERADVGAFATTGAATPTSRYTVATSVTTPVISDWNIASAVGSGTSFSADVRAIVQDMVNGTGWGASSKAVTLLFRRDPAISDSPVNTARQRAQAYDSGSSTTRPRLVINWTDPIDISSTYTAIRFENVKVPRGATVSSAKIKFTADASDTIATNLRIYAQASGLPAALASTDGNLNASVRPRTAAPVTWSAVPAWTAGQKYETPDVHSVLQEVVNRADWCSGNSVTILIEADAGRRVAKAYEQGLANAPELTVQWQPSTIPAGTSCQPVTYTRQIVNSTDDAEDRSTNMSIGGAVLDLVGESNYAQQVGLRFTNVQLPHGATITSAYLQFTASAQTVGKAESTADITTPIDLKIQGEAADNPATYIAKNDNIKNRAVTAASTAWSGIGAWTAESQYTSPAITGIVQELVNRGAWAQGNGMAFVITGTDAKKWRRAYSFDGSPAKAPRLIVTFQDNGTYNATRRVRDELLDVVDGFKPGGFTPSQDTLYEAALYFMGRGVDYGKKRGGLPAANCSPNPTISDEDEDAGGACDGPFEYTRVSHPDSYTGGAVSKSATCTDANPGDSACASEVITGSPIYKSPITAACQNNYIVFLTDGEPNSAHSTTKVKSLLTELTGTDTCEDTGDKACVSELLKALREKDVSTAFDDDQHVYTSTIGLYEGGGTWLAKLASSDKGGGGIYKTATDAASIAAGFRDALLKAADTTPSFVAAGTSVNAFNRTLNRDELYFAMFKPDSKPRWPGNVKKYKIGAPPALQIVDASVPPKAAINAATGDFDENAKSFWSDVTDGADVELGGAAGEIKNHTDRKLYTYLDSIAAPNKILSNDQNKLIVSNNNLVASMFGVGVASADVAQIVRWVRGEDVKDQDGDGNVAETRAVFADPLHSRPVAVTYGGDEDDPDVTIFVSTNSGFLHAIDNDDGHEIFGFIPEDLLPLQKILMDNVEGTKHPSGLDGSITTWVIDPDGDGKVLNNGDKSIQTDNKVLLFVGMRRGGRNYYALDVTDRSNPKILWTIKGGVDPDFIGLGQTWSQPLKAQIKVGAGAPKKVLIFGGGYDSSEDQDNAATRHVDGMGNAIFIVDALSGDLIWSGGNSVDYTGTWPSMKYAIPASVSGADINGDGLLDFFFVGDMGGQVWRFDIKNGSSAENLITGAVIADIAVDNSIPDTRRFYHSPALFLGMNGSTPYLGVAIGSGWRAHPLDDQVDDRFYMFRQENIFSAPTVYADPITEADLFDATDNTLGEGTAENVADAKVALGAAQGWMLKLPNQGEKVLSTPLIAGGNVYFNTYEPNASAAAAASCQPSVGTNRSYVMSVFDATPTVELNGATGLTSDDRSQEVLNAGIIDQQRQIIRLDENGEIQRIGVEGTGLKNLPGDIYNRVNRIYWYENR